MTNYRLPQVNGDDGAWGTLLNTFINKEHYDNYNGGTGTTDAGGHQNVTLRAGSATAGTAPLKFITGPLLGTPEAGAIEYYSDRFYVTQIINSVTNRRVIAAYDAAGAAGDIYYRDADANFIKLGIGSPGDVLKVSAGTLPSWGAAAGGGDMVLASVQSVTGLKTFDTDKLAIKGTSTGTMAISNANNTANNYIATLPNKTGTVAMLSDITGGTPATTVTDETTYGVPKVVGTSTNYAREDHNHGSPASTKDTTAVTGVLKGNGTTISAATDGSDYLSSSTGVTIAQTSGQTIGTTTNRVTKLWATDATVTNAIAGAVTGNAGSVTGATFTKNLTVDTGNVVVHGNADNTSALTIGSGAVSVSGSNTGDQNLSGYVTTAQIAAQTIGTTTNRLLKLWATDITVTSAIAGSVTGSAGSAGSVTNATLTTALTVDTGTVTLHGNVANSALTIGAGAVTVSGSNTGDQTSVSGNAGSVTGATFNKNLTVSTGNVTLNGNADNTSALTLGSGASSLTGAVSVASTRTLTVSKTITLTSATDDSIITVPSGIKTLAAFDANSNMPANNLIEGYAANATTPITLLVASPYQLYCTGSAAQTVTMPTVLSSMVVGQQWQIVNRSTGVGAAGVVSVYAYGGASLIVNLAVGASAIVTCISLLANTNASWSLSTGQNITVSANAPHLSWTPNIGDVWIDIS